MMPKLFDGNLIQERPAIYFASIPGQWLLSTTTPSWRIKDPLQGFQRMVNETRARKIAVNVLDQNRTFPNAIILATDNKSIKLQDSKLVIPDDVRFLVVDGQHRLWAQHFSEYKANYACMVHVGLTEKEMAQLFLEINDNQKRVPSSLRWDLVRLVKPKDDPSSLRASDIVFELTQMEKSPLYQRIDLTGEQNAIVLKQGSIAPSIRLIIRKPPLKDEEYELQIKILKSFFAAVKERDPEGWRNSSGALYSNRVIRALLEVMPDILHNKNLSESTPFVFLELFKKIDLERLDPAAIKTHQGSAGIAAIKNEIKSMLFKK